MTPYEWQSSDRPDEMLKTVAAKASARKLRLTAVEICRRIVWDEIRDERSRIGLVAVGLHDDGRLSDAELSTREAEAAVAHFEALGDRDSGDPNLLRDAAFMSAIVARLAVSSDISRGAIDAIVWAEILAAMTVASGLEREAAENFRVRAAAIIREIVGPLQHPLVLMPLPMLREYGGPAAAFRSRIGGTARGLAEGIVRDQAFDRLPILADALEDAGLDDRGVLDHMRNGTGHVRGCWALDLVLGRA